MSVSIGFTFSQQCSLRVMLDCWTAGLTNGVKESGMHEYLLSIALLPCLSSLGLKHGSQSRQTWEEATQSYHTYSFGVEQTVGQVSRE